METTRSKNRVAAPPASSATAEGLCATCNQAGACAWQARGDAATVWCEEFDAYKMVPARVTDGDVAALTAETPARVNGNHAPAISTGLCANCEDHLTCAISAVGGSVFYCEEYR